MWHIWSILGLALAVSLDSFGAGTTYGLRKIRIPFLSTLIIAGCSGMSMFFSMKMGAQIADWLSPPIANGIGATILILLGSWTLFHYFCSGDEEEKEKEVTSDSHRMASVIESRIWTLELRKLGLVIQILKTPAVADMDASGSISPTEALLLGIALSLDSLGAGLGAALLGLEPWIIAITITIMCGLFLRLGMWTGFRFSQNRFRVLLSYLPGMILIIMGLLRIW